MEEPFFLSPAEITNESVKSLQKDNSWETFWNYY